MIGFIHYFPFSDSAYSDVVSIKDGSVLNGKIIKKADNEIVLKNAYGSFTIKKTNIKKDI